MPLRITVLPASTQAGKETIRALLEDQSRPFVQGIYRNLSKVPSEFESNSNFEAVRGDVSGGSELDFSGSDAVFYVPPPTYDGTDSKEFAKAGANKVKNALQKAPKVKRLVVFSAIGAQHDNDIGILVVNHIADEILKNSAPEVVIAKTGFFMENWASVFDTIKAEQPYFESYFTPLDHRVPTISLIDIGNICAQKLLETGQSLPSNPHVIDLHGPRGYSANDVKNVLEEITQRKINIVAIEQDQLLEYYGGKVPAPYAQELVDMTTAMLPGGLVAKDFDKEGVIRGSVELADVLRKLASGETTKAASGAF